MTAERLCFSKRLLWAQLLLIFLVVCCSTEVTASSQHRSENRNVLSHLYFDTERPPPQLTPPASPLAMPTLAAYPKPPQKYGAVSRKSESQKEIQVPIHPSIKKYISYYQGKGRKSLITTLKRSSSHISSMSEILESYGVPSELLFVAFVESRFRSTARGKGNAAGFWQLVPGTARMLGLRVDNKVDERFDPIKSTHAAARHLRALHDQFNSWPLALAAYNAGEGTVKKIIGNRWSEDLRDISILNPLPTSTREYVSKVMAVIHVTRNDMLLDDNI